MESFTSLQFQNGPTRNRKPVNIFEKSYKDGSLIEVRTYLKYSEAADVNGVVGGGAMDPDELLLRSRVLFEASQIASNCVIEN